MTRPLRSALSDMDRALLIELAGDSIRFDEPMSRRTTLGIGGPADAWFSPASIAELQAVVVACGERGITMVPIGGGSNLLVCDSGIRAVCISTRRLRALDRVGEVGILAEAGVSTGKLLSSATGWALSGLEFLAGVPGSVGGGLIMNAGTRLGEFKDVTESVTSVELRSGNTVIRSRDDCGFAYRSSKLPAGEIVVRAEFLLTPSSREQISHVVREFRDQRRSAEPKGHATAGSVFKNPPGDYAGRLIEATGLKGARVGGALCSPAHANWFVNTGGATAADMLELIEMARDRVRSAHGVTLELEWKILGDQ